jgi:predicted esterase
MKRVVMAAGLIFWSATLLQGREVVQITWPTLLASPPPVLEKAAADWLPMFRVALATLPEATTVGLVLSQPSLLGLPVEAAARLTPLVAKRYEMIAADNAYAKAASALPYCFSVERPTAGQASLYMPDQVSSTTPFIVFLHGYGGSFLWYQHYLSEVFPEAVILAPAYGIDTQKIPAEYVIESIKAAEKHLGKVLSLPRLIGLSAGGFGACRVFASRPRAFASLEVLAAYPPTDVLSRLPQHQSIRFIAGGNEMPVYGSAWETAKRELAARHVKVTFTLVPKADHFFMLTHPEPTVKWLKE